MLKLMKLLGDQGSELILFRETEVKLVEANETIADLRGDIKCLIKQLIESERMLYG